MIRRRFVASVVAGLAGLFGAKAARGEKVERSVLSLYFPRYFAVVRLSDGEVMAQRDNPKKPTPGAKPLNPPAKCFPATDRACAFSNVSLAHARELAEAARLRYVVGSAMKVNV